MKLTLLIATVSILGILCWFIITGVDQNGDVVATDAESTSLETTGVSEEDYFLQNAQCIEFKDDVAIVLAEQSAESSIWTERLVEIFYSPQRNECLYVSEVIWDKDNVPGWWAAKSLARLSGEVEQEVLAECKYITSYPEFYAQQEVLDGLSEDADQYGCDQFDETVRNLKM